MIRTQIFHFQWYHLQSKKPVSAGTAEPHRLVIRTEISNYKGCLASQEPRSETSRWGRTRSSCRLFEAPARSAGGHACPHKVTTLSVLSFLRLYSLLCASISSSQGLGLCSLSPGILKAETKWGVLPDNYLLNVCKVTGEQGLMNLLKNMEKDSI